MSTTDKVNQFARNVWLAGLGAYGRSAEVVAEKLDKTYEESNQLFNDLVSKGSEIQTSIDAKLKSYNLFEQKVDEVREKLGLNRSVSDAQIDELTAKVEALTDLVMTLAEKRLAQSEQAATPTAEKTATPTAEKAASPTSEATTPANSDTASRTRRQKAKPTDQDSAE